MDLQRGMKAGMDKVVQSLVEKAKPIESESEIKQVSTYLSSRHVHTCDSICGGIAFAPANLSDVQKNFR